MTVARKYFSVALTAALLCSCSSVPEGRSVNLAKGRTAIASSTYDYNLTAQLLTDGVLNMEEPSWLRVTTAQGELPRREKEWTLDAGPYSSNFLKGGSNFIEYEWSRQRFSASCVRIVGTLAFMDGASSLWSVRCLDSSGEGFIEVGSIGGEELPGRLRGHIKVADPNKQSEEVSCPARSFRLEIPLEEAVDFSRFRVEFKAEGGVFWEINSVDFTEGKCFAQSSDTGPYDSKDARGFNVLPSEVFSSAWMSADASPQQVSIDLGGECVMERASVHWVHKAAKAWMEISRDGLKWTRPVDVSGEDGQTSWFDLKGRKGRFVRLCMEGADGSGHFAISEIEVLGARKKAVPEVEGAWRLQRASEVEGGGEAISLPDYDASSWVNAVVPGTVLYSYIASGAVPDPGISDNNLQISESFFNSDFWYRWETSVDADRIPGRRTLLTFDGINWKAEVFMNGKHLGNIAGAFKKASFDVTEIIREDNVIAVRIIKPAHFGAVKEKNAESPDFNGGQLGADNPTFHATVGWDWIPTVRGRDMGIWNDVHLDFVQDVVLSKPLVRTVLAEDDTLSTMTFSVVAENLSDMAVSGILEGSIDSISFRKRILLKSKELETVVFSPEDFPQLRNRALALWWPNGYGRTFLHPATFKFTPEGSAEGNAAGTPAGTAISSGDNCSVLSFAAGLREFTYKDQMSDLTMFINGHRFFPKGGNWGFSEFNLRYSSGEYDTAVRLHKEMNLNMIRNWVGQTGDEEFYEACDRHGIVVWQDFWLANPADGPDPDDEDMFADNAADFVGRIRSHPCVGLYCGRNEGYPPASLDARLRGIVAGLHGDIAYIPSSADDGVSGHGPYRAVEPDTYFRIPANKFHTERGMPAIMNYPDLLRTMTEAHIWPSDDVWGQHDFTRTGAQGDTAFVGILRRRYGDQVMESARNFASYAQYLNYDGYRAMYEANNSGRKGLLIWMSHSCWPSLAWQTYDYWFDRTAAFEGVAKACEPLHIQINPAARVVEVVNSSIGPRNGLKASIVLRDPSGKEVYSRRIALDIDEDRTIAVMDISDVPDGPVTVDLRLEDSGGALLSENRYMRNFRGGDDMGDYRVLVGGRP